MRKDRLKEYRKEIDKIDKVLIKAYIRRKELVRKIAEYKKDNDLQIGDIRRENEILKKIKILVKTKDNINEIKEIYKKIFNYSKKEQRKVIKRSKNGR